MDASIIITNYNQSHILKYAIDALCQQKTDFSFEIIISDDGSSPEHIENIRKIIAHKKNIKFITHPHENMRPSAVRNNAIKQASSPILIFIDGDIVSLDDFVEKHIRTHKENGGKLVCCGNRTWFDISELGISGPINTEAADICKKKEAKEREVKIKQIQSSFPVQGFYTCNISFTNSAEVIFDENFRGWGIEDTEMVYRMHNIHNYKLIYNQDIEVLHYDDNSVSQNPFRTREQNKLRQFMANLLYFQSKYENDLILRKYITKSLMRFDITGDCQIEVLDPQNIPENIEMSEKEMIDFQKKYVKFINQ